MPAHGATDAVAYAATKPFKSHSSTNTHLMLGNPAPRTCFRSLNHASLAPHALNGMCKQYCNCTQARNRKKKVAYAAKLSNCSLKLYHLVKN